ncbi:MAG: universal stress protein [Alphaproteobacteria bacterium]|nr:universal stress protein [Alphaproteobacteria bacterium]
MSETQTAKSTEHPSDDGPILVAVDFTADSEAALRWACEYAATVGAPVRILHVVHDPAEAPGSYRKNQKDHLQPMEDVAREMMDEFVATAREEHPQLEALATAETTLVKGIPDTRILEAATNTGARMIVMGSRGRTGLPHLLLGSKAERVVQLSPIPVTIVKAPRNDR